jgi:uncharacterized membrane protein
VQGEVERVLADLCGQRVVAHGAGRTDAGVHARCGDGFWQKLTDAMTEHFRKSEFTEGIVQGVKRAGELLAEHFPRRPDDANELPDRVEHD